MGIKLVMWVMFDVWGEKLTALPNNQLDLGEKHPPEKKRKGKREQLQQTTTIKRANN